MIQFLEEELVSLEENLKKNIEERDFRSAHTTDLAIKEVNRKLRALYRLHNPHLPQIQTLRQEIISIEMRMERLAKFYSAYKKSALQREIKFKEQKINELENTPLPPQIDNDLLIGVLEKWIRGKIQTFQLTDDRESYDLYFQKLGKYGCLEIRSMNMTKIGDIKYLSNKDFLFSLGFIYVESPACYRLLKDDTFGPLDWLEIIAGLMFEMLCSFDHAKLKIFYNENDL